MKLGYTAVEIVSDEMVMQRKAFSVQEYDLYDVLESSFFGEQKSIGIVMEYIQNGEYERQVEGKIDFKKTYKPDAGNAEFYNMVTKRVNAILRIMAFSLISGLHIPLEKYEIEDLIMKYLDEDMPEELITADLVYDVNKQSFCVLNSDGEVIIEDVEIEEAMELYNKYLVGQEKDELYRRAMEEVSRKEK